jgi:hypothetical protein
MKAFLFKVKTWQYASPEYILVHAENELDARNKAFGKVKYNNGVYVPADDYILVTYF